MAPALTSSSPQPWQTWAVQDKQKLLREVQRRISVRDLDTPGKLAKVVEPTTIQTPALDILDAALMDAEAGRNPWLIFTMPPQEGKLVDHDELVPTPSGWRRHGDLRRGDLVYHPCGRPIRVTAVGGAEQASMRVDTIDGGSVVVHPAHEWTIWDRAQGKQRTVETRELARRKLKSGGRYVIFLPARGVLEAPKTDLPMDPYTLGVWLGDGSTTKSAITHHLDDLYEIPYEVSSRHIHPTTGVITTYYRGLWADLKRAGVAGNKHIPDAYLWADEQSRWDLLCGLIDTDGSIDERGQLLFANTNIDLAQGVAHLIRSFGHRVGERTIQPRTSTSGIVGKRPVHVVTYSPADGRVPARLERKRIKIEGKAVARRVAIIGVHEVTPRPGRCISVDSPDGLYLVGRHLLPTHNSQRVSRTFPIWCLLRDPARRIAIVSYADALAMRWGRQNRNDIQGNTDLGLAVAPDIAAAKEWQLDGARGGIVTAGIKSGLTGRPVDVLIIDDPLADQKEADSPTARQTCKDFWRSTASTRLPETSVVIIVMTRWHEDDLAGWLLETQPGDFKLINIPAQADHKPENGETDVLGRVPGEYMASTRERSIEGWEKRRRSMGSRAWNALCQGRPAPEEGGIFRRTWWRIHDIPRAVERSDGTWYVPGAEEVLISLDAAFKETHDSDYVAFGVWARRGPKLDMVDIVFDRMEFTETCRVFEMLVAKWPQATLRLIEDKANGPAVISALRHRIGGLVPYTPVDSKIARARACAPFVEAGDVGLPDPLTNPKVAAFIEQAAAFPNAANDDLVDMFTQAAIRLLRIGEADLMDELVREMGLSQPGDDIPPPRSWTLQQAEETDADNDEPWL